MGKRKMKGRVVPPSVDREVDEEFDHHLAMIVRTLVSEGWSEEEARAEARRRLGNVRRWKAESRVWGERRDGQENRRRWWDEVRQDLRFALRQLRRAPAFAAVTVLTLGIAIGANTAVFSVVNGVLLRPLPYPEPGELSIVWTRYLPPSGFDIDKFVLSGPEALDIQEESRTLESLGIFARSDRTLTGDGDVPERIRVGLYSASMLPTLSVRPRLGRWFSEEEDVPDGPRVTILSHGLWESRFGADPAIVGRTIMMNGVPTEVVGVMPRDFDFPYDARAALPLGLTRESQGGRASHNLMAIGRLADGMTQDDLDAELSLLAERWAREYEHNVAHHPWSQELHTEVVARAPERLGLLMAAVGLVLLVACANVSNLLLTRAERRQTEVAVRRTLGAGRARITRQLATESLVLAAVSAVVGLALAVLGLEALLRVDPTALPRLDEIRIDGNVLAFVVAVTGLTTLLFGIVPAHLAGRHASGTLASSGAHALGGRPRTALRRLLVTGEVAVSLVVVILAGLVVKSFGALTSTDPRMDPSGLITFTVSLPEADYPDPANVSEEYRTLLDRLRAVPGVESATASTRLPFGGMSQWDFVLDDRPPRQEGELAWNAGISHVTDDYFRTLGIPILAGRSLGPEDRRDAASVAVVSETMASRYWPGESVIGKRFGYDGIGDTIPWITVVGLVPDPVTSGLDSDPYPHVYVPQAQGGVSTYVTPRTMRMAVRTSVEPESAVPALRSAVSDFDPDIPLYAVSTMEDIVSSSFAGPRITTTLLGIFAVVALILAGVGVYGVISYAVAGRTREIGVRVALGAERREITRLVLGEGARPVLVGVGLGLVLAWLSTRLVEAMLYGVEPTDPVTFVTLPLLLLLVGIAASLAPALRATRIAPTEALRVE
ncbi:MAG: ABC transporter permease [Longimicrobiales bacterium]|nr:ABC transporter permease [Longimicrobiales bacterium]